MPRPPTTQAQVLELIAKYGVINTLTLQKLLVNKIGTKWIRSLMQVLELKGLVVKATPFTEGRPTHYWILPDNDNCREEISKRCNIPVGQFRNKKLRYTHYPHENIVTLFQVSLERQIPNIRILREASPSMKELPTHLISDEIRDNGYMPDLCIGVPIDSHDNVQSFRWIGVEIDRRNRSSSRVLKRLNIYARHTGFSGLIYLMPDVRSVKNILSEYQKVQSMRIIGFEKSFLATSVAPRDIFDVKKLQLNVGDSLLNMSDYLNLVACFETQNRDSAMIGFQT